MRHDLFLIFKESLHNAVRHSECESIDVDLEMERSSLKLRVTDDGDGFDLSPSTEGQGMGNMRRRAAKIGGQLEVHSSRGQGTEIVLTVPLRA